ncbi:MULTISPECIES: ribbon-helix-helix domain-containing protein [unclassified Tolypothrix]|uniref:ribbon-helix-helix domain-containing protein n=2 Tax=unclassified Tolypothrix TaxID=2649714 RepID=UPI0005EAC34C|nr:MULTISPECIES: hypothetical protein [unclassified Tolypothrix]EKE98185.1 hypothetical protein FDUTEX481_04202 [Tolypothrix sp. PCC 7601]UYD38713.1 CopG family transcriptional regulator [Tolypothrix sp. PCC 7601]BAY95820.1 hypothetical protein NIES3275_78970 [Microchaete diplosiphon NIES-3275]
MGVIIDNNYTYLCLLAEMPSKKPRVVIYLDPEMNEFLRQWAEDERRTLNNLITVLLEKAVTDKKESKDK